MEEIQHIMLITQPAPRGAEPRPCGEPLSGELAGKHSWTYSGPASRGGGAWSLLSMGEACREPLSRGWRRGGGRRGAGRAHGMLRNTSALLRPGTQTRPQVVQLLPFSRPFTPQRGEPVGPHCL